MKRTLKVLCFLSLSPLTYAATLAVLPGEAIQPKVDAAAPGDIIAIFGGTYPGDVTINKAVRLVEVDGQDVTITGNVTWTGVTNAPPFEGFTVGSAGKGITVTNTTGFMIKNVDTRPGFGLRINGASKVGIVGGFSSLIAQDGGDLTVNLITTTGGFTTTTNCDKTVALRATIGGDVAWNSKKAWFGYSKCQRFAFNGINSNVVLINSTLDVTGRATDIFTLGGSSNKLFMANCKIKGAIHGDQSYYQPSGWVAVGYPGRCVIVGAGNSGTIANNYVQITNIGYNRTDYQDAGDGVNCSSAGFQIINNLMEGCRYAFTAPYGTVIKNNHLFNCSATERGGVVSLNSFAGDPLYVVGQAPLLQVSSPCINAGVNDPILNDLDGTRNDIGPGGGGLFDPEGWTTIKPVVISFDLAPQQLLKGVDTQVTLSKGQAVAQP